MGMSLGVVSREGLKGKMPLPLVLVHSGNTTMMRSGFARTSASRSVRCDDGGGASCTGARA